MFEQILKSIIGYVVPAVLGFLIAKVVNYRKKNDSLKEGLKTLLQSNITNTYFYYEPMKIIPDYIYRNVLNEFKAYKRLEGNDFIDSIMDKMKDWKLTRTDVLKDK